MLCCHSSASDGKALQDGQNKLALFIRMAERGKQHPGCCTKACGSHQRPRETSLHQGIDHTACAWVQEAHAELAALEASFRARAESSQAALAKLVEAKETKEREMYIKVSPPARHCMHISIEPKHGGSGIKILAEPCCVSHGMHVSSKTSCPDNASLSCTPVSD